MDTDALKELIQRELPGLLQGDPSLRAYILELTRQEHPSRVETEDRFYQLLGELRRDREEWNRKWDEQQAKQDRKWDEQARKWEEQNRKWDEWIRKSDAEQEEQDRKWDEQNRKWDEWIRKSDAEQEEQNRKWDEQNRKWDEWIRKSDAEQEEQNRKWDEQNRKWDEQNRKWDESIRNSDEKNREWAEQWKAHQLQHKEEFDRMHGEIMALARKQERAVGALGSRWGTQSEKAFRDALAGILEENFGVQVINVNDFDDQGEVFGRPDQVELDVVIKNGLLLICELKSSIDKAGMYAFERKARFYEKRHQRQANRLLVISPMIDARARKVAEQLGIELYGDSDDVESL